MRLIDIYYKAPYFIRYPAFVITGAIQSRNRYGKVFLDDYNKLMLNMSMSEDEIFVMQNELTRNILQHAYINVPYYNKLFKDAGFNPYSYKDKSDLVKLPILTKDIIINNFDDLCARNIPKKNMIRHRSGGTTGNPISFLIPKELKGPFNYATLYRFYSWAGVKYGDPRVTVAGRLITKKPPYFMKNYAEKQLYVCAHYLSEENLKDIIDEIIKFNPIFLQGHPSALSIVANYIVDKSLYTSAKAVFTTSENLYPDQRDIIERAFNCKVFDTYGLGEMVVMASECSENCGYHMAPEYGLTEIINTEQYEDGMGEIISTSLQNYAMPFIRYKTGDLGKMSLKKCSCGCNFPMIEKISGRIDDVIVLDNGKKILPLSIRISLKNHGITDFQIIVNNNNLVYINILKIENSLTKEQLDIMVINILKDIFGKHVNIIIDMYKNPIVTKNGKQQMIINKKNSIMREI